jgi:hypothetical protein
MAGCEAFGRCHFDGPILHHTATAESFTGYYSIPCSGLGRKILEFVGLSIPLLPISWRRLFGHNIRPVLEPEDLCLAVLSNSWAGSARRRDLSRRLAGHRIFDETDNGCDDGTRDATANRLSKQRTDINVAGRTLKDRQECREKCSTARAPKCASNGVAERAEVEVFHGSACGIAADCPGDELDYQIDNCR